MIVVSNMWMLAGYYQIISNKLSVSTPPKTFSVLLGFWTSPSKKAKSCVMNVRLHRHQVYCYLMDINNLCQTNTGQAKHLVQKKRHDLLF